MSDKTSKAELPVVIADTKVPSKTKSVVPWEKLPPPRCDHFPKCKRPAVYRVLREEKTDILCYAHFAEQRSKSELPYQEVVSSNIGHIPVDMGDTSLVGRDLSLVNKLPEFHPVTEDDEKELQKVRRKENKKRIEATNAWKQGAYLAWHMKNDQKVVRTGMHGTRNYQIGHYIYNLSGEPMYIVDDKGEWKKSL